MLGFSYYLNDPIDSETEKYFKSMSEHTFREVFTSLHIPEDDPRIKTTRMKDLMKLSEYYGLSVVVDVDKSSLSYLPQNISSKLTLRLDDGFTPEDIKNISTEMPVALNASTIDKTLYQQLQESNVEINNIEAWHNFYPRPETGLDDNWFKSKNQWLKSLGFKTQAFIPGDKHLRGPIHSGLPTLESQRDKNLLASSIELDKLGIDKVIIGDPYLSVDYRKKFKEYYIQKTLSLNYCPIDDSNRERLERMTYSNRPDPARDVVRIKESRMLKLASITPQNTVERTKGSITTDNKRYGRYMGEIQIAKRNLPNDDRINVLGHISKSDLDLIDLIGPNQKIKFNYFERMEN
ncbi:MupG family TIM beta-alpha barrel fold protein [Companilactobacillus ginsenosidimutans]|uniref:DUF871 domain-containing protein n=1 Tax=Companilactobacillus ginsenosidimutans TaxID=1007676 RepID=A0A0H4QF39_9LACO|nr:MupG family TIM beta-alpha barrel fold protein [Companilactobacillus ginsenosidimutans]AKP66557.1 hypothetical protein ABM34_02640 [Companilactobacillus ginsenosidimutans]